MREGMAKALAKSKDKVRGTHAAKRAPRPAAPQNLGHREQKKKDKLERIIAVARQLFVTNGFDATKIRDIARQARVATGTIFKYAEDKRDLVFLTVNDEFEALTGRAFAAVPVDAPLLDQLADLFRNYYVYYYENKRLARILLREIFFFNVGQQAPRTVQNVQSTIDRLAGVIRAAQKRGEVRRTEDPKQIARLLYSIYQIEVRRWVNQEPLNLKKGMATLNRMLALALRGAEPQAE